MLKTWIQNSGQNFRNVNERAKIGIGINEININLHKKVCILYRRVNGTTRVTGSAGISVHLGCVYKRCSLNQSTNGMALHPEVQVNTLFIIIFWPLEHMMVR